jgi:hypothetical protein
MDDLARLLPADVYAAELERRRRVQRELRFALAWPLLVGAAVFAAALAALSLL